MKLVHRMIANSSGSGEKNIFWSSPRCLSEEDSTLVVIRSSVEVLLYLNIFLNDVDQTCDKILHFYLLKKFLC